MFYMRNAPPGEGGAREVVRAERAEDTTPWLDRQGPQLPRDHPTRFRARAERAARERVRWCIDAFNALMAEEQHLFAERVCAIMQAGEPVPSFDGLEAVALNWSCWASLAELREYILAAFARLPKSEAKHALAALGRLA